MYDCVYPTRTAVSLVYYSPLILTLNGLNPVTTRTQPLLQKGMHLKYKIGPCDLNSFGGRAGFKPIGPIAQIGPRA